MRLERAKETTRTVFCSVLMSPTPLSVLTAPAPICFSRDTSVAWTSRPNEKEARLFFPTISFDNCRRILPKRPRFVIR